MVDKSQYHLLVRKLNRKTYEYKLPEGEKENLIFWLKKLSTTYPPGYPPLIHHPINLEI